MKAKAWHTTERVTIAETPVFSLRRDRKHRRERRDRSHDFYIIEAADWVNVIPVTSNGEIVFIELHRHGTDELSLEIPGGMVDPEDPSPMAAAAREMREETGYASDTLVTLGSVHPNPALQENRCYSFLAPNARRVGEPRPDETEDIEVVTYPRAELSRLLREGRISHALVVAALLWYFLHEDSDGGQL